MKIIIAGGRDYTERPGDLAQVAEVLQECDATEIVSGMAKGADKWGEQVAWELKLPLKQFEAHWETYGKGAGAIRNTTMAEYADGLIALPGGAGTEHMISVAKKMGLRVWELK